MYKLPLFSRSTSSRQDQKAASSSARSFTYHAYTAWLFTYSDLKTIIIPQSLFGICGGLCAESFHLPAQQRQLLLRRIPLVIVWTWINLLPFAIDNQRLPLAIMEDRLNKSWRPLPSGRITPPDAKRSMVALYPLAVIFSSIFGGLSQCIALIGLGVWYNDLGGADRNPLVRNFINACGFLCYTSGAMEVAYGAPLHLTGHSPLPQWLAVISAVVLSSVHSQDMSDQAGDDTRGRRTMPLVFGDWNCRVGIALVVPFWSCFVAWYWHAHPFISGVVVALGAMVAWRTLMLRTVSEDKRTFLLWNGWIVVLYFLPCVHTTVLGNDEVEAC